MCLQSCYRNTKGIIAVNILFLSLIRMESLDERGIYQDLLREFVRQGHKVYVISPVERRYNCKTEINHFENYSILQVRTGNIQKTNILEKGISTLLIEPKFIFEIKKYYSDIKFDLVLYPTPPITLGKAVAYVKKRDNAKSYLMLKDIFPQNAVDLGMLKRHGIMALIYRFFRCKEEKLYALSDCIGCMSQANVEYLIHHNPKLKPQKVEVCPNSIKVKTVCFNQSQRNAVRTKYGIPIDKKVFVYGGNLGKPQGIQFLIECLKTQEQNQEAFFLIVGSGTEYDKLKDYFNTVKPTNMMLLNSLPKEEYENMVASCDVGLVFLDYRFTIPNFPSRILSYMQAALPVLVCSDPNTDMGDIVSDNGFGWKCLSNNIENFENTISECLKSDCHSMGAKAVAYLEEHYSVERTYKTIVNAVVQM